MLPPCGRRVYYAHNFPACRMRRLKGCPDGNASTAWDYGGLLCNLYRDAGPKRCHHSQTSRAQSPLNPFYTWYNMMLKARFHFAMPYFIFFMLYLSIYTSKPALLIINPQHSHRLISVESGRGPPFDLWNFLRAFCYSSDVFTELWSFWYWI